jgi:predicted AlkP superfamily pyrophosphatase or phosphodiesterase
MRTTRHQGLLLGLVLLLCGGSLQAQLSPLAAERPALVLAVMVDQLRYDYLTRQGSEFDAGLARLLKEGAVFTNANYEAAPTVTAVGHSTFLSGATPSVSGIAGNSWYSRQEGMAIQSITDNNVTPLGTTNGASPHRLRVSTIGDELKQSGHGGKVYGVSLKDRSAILPAGRGADGAFWLVNGNFVSSSWYFPELPAWASEFNARKPADRFAGVDWMGSTLPATPGAELYRAIDSTPFADQLVLEFALQVLDAEALGTGDQTDLLAVSFSAMDYLGHASGPDTPQMREMVLSIDKKVGALLAAAERQAGKGKVLLVLSSDHGVAPVPEEQVAQQLPGGRYDGRAEAAAVQQALVTTFGAGEYILANSELGYYLNYGAAADPGVSRSAIEDVAAAALRRLPHVARVYTRTALEQARVAGDRIDQRVINGFHREESGDLVVVHDPNWLGGGSGTTHGSPYHYDTHVPLIFWGPRSLVKPGLYHGEAAIHDIAPTLATLLRVAVPNGAQGRVLHEMLP